MSPFKSEAQRRKFQQMLREGKITQELYDAFEEGTDRKRLMPHADDRPTHGKPKSKKALKNLKKVRNI